jgi:hypothetical protein
LLNYLGNPIIYLKERIKNAQKISCHDILNLLQIFPHDLEMLFSCAKRMGKVTVNFPKPHDNDHGLYREIKAFCEQEKVICRNLSDKQTIDTLLTEIKVREQKHYNEGIDYLRTLMGTTHFECNLNDLTLRLITESRKKSNMPANRLGQQHPEATSSFTFLSSLPTIAKKGFVLTTQMMKALFFLSFHKNIHLESLDFITLELLEILAKAFNVTYLLHPQDPILDDKINEILKILPSKSKPIQQQANVPNTSTTSSMDGGTENRKRQRVDGISEQAEECVLKSPIS